MEIMENIPRLLMENNKAFISIVTHELSKCGITVPQAIVLDVIRNTPKTIGEISKAIDLSNSTVSGIVDRLERNGLVERQRDQQDRRVVWVALTKDKEKLEQYPVIQEKYFGELFSDLFRQLSNEELIQLNDSLQILQKLFEMKQNIHTQEGSD
ncbi:MarR family winged helix-turn-helix transcriptional regulator [Ammoniphilus resinae]|uniref:DNA-binding MarR family transcriptional regulator n=1 Tax=Ammoniphilus resinae TaxID=861532 RepID=A0ABS4GMA5_9BACL|nr:MarR family transcriptional regulator [Ammoniphilus resinae]MBP1931386.1 DNA-binding MarR family transcriptional regulator [Ammoniphilus resinae]